MSATDPSAYKDNPATETDAELEAARVEQDRRHAEALAAAAAPVEVPAGPTQAELAATAEAERLAAEAAKFEAECAVQAAADIAAEDAASYAKRVNDRTAELVKAGPSTTHVTDSAGQKFPVEAAAV